MKFLSLKFKRLKNNNVIPLYIIINYNIIVLYIIVLLKLAVYFINIFLNNNLYEIMVYEPYKYIIQVSINA